MSYLQPIVCLRWAIQLPWQPEQTAGDQRRGKDTTRPVWEGAPVTAALVAEQTLKA